MADRQKAGRAYVYRASVSQREWLLQTLEALVGDLFRRGPDLVLSAFVDLAERTGAEQLEELERVVRSRRGRSEEGES